MPLYEYACGACGNHFDIRQGFNEAPLTVCPTCGGAVRRVIQPVGIVFKGSGFYKNDSRSSSEASVPAADRKATDAANPAATPATPAANGSTPAATEAATAKPAAETSTPAAS